MAGNYLFYPGCSLEAGGGYLESINAVAGALGIELTELPDWNCCGATMLKAYSRGNSCATAARNFSLVKRSGSDTLVVVCNACLSTLLEQRNYLREDAVLREKVSEALKAAGHELFLDIKIRHLLDVIIEDCGLDKVKALVKKPLKGKRLGAYYGCLYTRPGRDGLDKDNPGHLEGLISAIGGDNFHFSAKEYCCGAAQAVGHPQVGKKMASDILIHASRKGADALLTICPLCNLNLESLVGKVKLDDADTGVLFFTQAMGLAFGMTPDEIGVNKLLSPPEKMLKEFTEVKP